MIIIYFIAIIISYIVYACTSKLNVKLRLILSISIFIILSLLATLTLNMIGDKPLPGAINVYPEK